ncbi:hypothetical protein F9802_03245 [Bacillus aerolatus]|uniref:Histidine phosphatase family protein n=1 Tax=Bacillus aerolatus TaxID=2653354 RepID=A0A6I1FKA1_9BACI|nr:hypothetical protein [Bacillus aerolatus]KAB7709138.1 hypothetical protein F9802_03245 [Bacillus aerolatus]
MEIILMRHGKSSYTNTAYMTCKEFAKWGDDYGAAGILQGAAIPDETKKKVKEEECLSLLYVR